MFNSNKKESYWIWKSNDFLVLEDTKIHNQIEAEETQKTTALVFEFVEQDSNQDGVLDGKDKKSIEYFDLAARKSVPIVNQLDRTIGIRQTGSNEVLFSTRALAKATSRV